MTTDTIDEKDKGIYVKENLIELFDKIETICLEYSAVPIAQIANFDSKTQQMDIEGLVAFPFEEKTIKELFKKSKLLIPSVLKR